MHLSFFAIQLFDSEITLSPHEKAQLIFDLELINTTVKMEIYPNSIDESFLGHHACYLLWRLKKQVPKNMDKKNKKVLALIKSLYLLLLKYYLEVNESTIIFDRDFTSFYLEIENYVAYEKSILKALDWNLSVPNLQTDNSAEKTRLEGYHDLLMGDNSNEECFDSDPFIEQALLLQKQTIEDYYLIRYEFEQLTKLHRLTTNSYQPPLSFCEDYNEYYHKIRTAFNLLQYAKVSQASIKKSNKEEIYEALFEALQREEYEDFFELLKIKPQLLTQRHPSDNSKNSLLHYFLLKANQKEIITCFKFIKKYKPQKTGNNALGESILFPLAMREDTQALSIFIWLFELPEIFKKNIFNTSILKILGSKSAFPSAVQSKGRRYSPKTLWFSSDRKEQSCNKQEALAPPKAKKHKNLLRHFF